MRRQHNSYLVRHWTLDPEHSGVIVEHVQSGVQAQLPSLDAAHEWIESHLAQTDSDHVSSLVTARDRAGFVVIHGAETVQKDEREQSAG